MSFTTGYIVSWCFEKGEPAELVKGCKKKDKSSCTGCSFRGSKSQGFYGGVVLGKS